MAADLIKVVDRGIKFKCSFAIFVVLSLIPGAASLPSRRDNFELAALTSIHVVNNLMWLTSIPKE